MNYLTGAETQANVAVLWVVAKWLAIADNGFPVCNRRYLQKLKP